MASSKYRSETQSADGPASDLWRHTLARIPTLFGRLVYLASLRTEASGQYEHPGLAQMVGDEQCAETLRRSHLSAFQEWLCMNLEQQKSDLAEYLTEQSGSRREIHSEWLEIASYRGVIPPAAKTAESLLYLTDLEALLAILRHAYSAAASLDPAASPLR